MSTLCLLGENFMESLFASSWNILLTVQKTSWLKRVALENFYEQANTGNNEAIICGF